MATDLTDPIFTDENAARAHLESLRWPDGPVCPHCGSVDNAAELKGKSTRPGVYKCRGCRKPFSATIGTLYERSHIPLHKWLLATYLLCSSKKGISAHQLFRMLGFGSYRTAWFMAHRIREGMRELHPETGLTPLGGKNKVVEADETYVGGKAKNRMSTAPIPPKEAVMSLVERRPGPQLPRCQRHGGYAAPGPDRSDREGQLPDDRRSAGFREHRHGVPRARHRQPLDRGVRPRRLLAHQHGRELLLDPEAGIIGTYHHVSPKHLKRYLGEFDFRHNERAALGVDDMKRSRKAVAGVAGKRLTYRQPDGHAGR